MIGLAAAYALRRRGCAVTVVEAGRPGGAASHGNAGWIVPSLSGPVPAPGLARTSARWMLRPGNPLYVRPRADPAFLRWLLTFWRRCNARDYRAGLEAVAELNRRTMALFDAYRADGVAFEGYADGLVFAYLEPHEMERDIRGLELLRPFGYDAPALLDGAAIRDLEPALTDAVVGGYHVPQERHVRPDSLITGLVDRLEADGVTLLAETPVVGIAHRDGRVTAVETPRGWVAADAIVVCAGAWTPAVLRLAGVRRIPIEAGKGYSLDYAPPPALPEAIRRPLYLHEARVAVTPLQVMVRLAGTMELSGLNGRIPPARIAAIARVGTRYLRGWPPDPHVATPWTGMRPMTPDGLPVIGPVPGFANLLVASGHAMLGLTLAPATAEALADLLTTDQPPALLRPFDPSRFGRDHGIGGGRQAAGGGDQRSLRYVMTRPTGTRRAVAPLMFRSYAVAGGGRV